MRALGRHLTGAAHDDLPFHPSCPTCRAQRVQGTLPAGSIVGPRARAGVLAAVLAGGTLGPGGGAPAPAGGPLAPAAAALAAKPKSATPAPAPPPAAPSVPVNPGANAIGGDDD